jgi:hypothetical protein
VFERDFRPFRIKSMTNNIVFIYAASLLCEFFKYSVKPHLSELVKLAIALITVIGK